MKRFYDKVDPSGGPGACHVWTASVQNKGYGQFRFGGTMRLAHRVAWFLGVGLIPVGLDVLHRCDNPRCVNVRHLFIGTHLDNMSDMYAKGRRVAAFRLTPSEVREIRAARDSSYSVAERYGVTARYVRQIRAGTRRAAVA